MKGKSIYSSTASVKIQKFANWGFQPILDLHIFWLEILNGLKAEEWNNWVDFVVLKHTKFYLLG